MTLDLLVLGAALLFAILGGYSGAARQVAQLFAMVVAYACARPLGSWLAPHLSQALGGPKVLGLIAATLLCFIAVMLAVRLLLTGALRWLLRGEDEEDRGLDRSLGFLLGGAKALFVVYLLLSGLTFVEQHVSIAGKRLGVTPQRSYAFQFASRFNFFELTQFGGVRDLLALSRAAKDPAAAQRLRADPAYQALRKHPKVSRALENEEVQRAAERGDFRALLRSDAVLELIRDPEIAQKLSAAADSL